MFSLLLLLWICLFILLQRAIAEEQHFELLQEIDIKEKEDRQKSEITKENQKKLDHFLVKVLYVCFACYFKYAYYFLNDYLVKQMYRMF